MLQLTALLGRDAFGSVVAMVDRRDESSCTPTHVHAHDIMITHEHMEQADKPSVYGALRPHPPLGGLIDGAVTSQGLLAVEAPRDRQNQKKF